LKVFDFEKYGENLEDLAPEEEADIKNELKSKTDYYKDLSENIEYLYDQKRER
jgi:hypothetical protein